jgi:hypothetical protein
MTNEAISITFPAISSQVIADLNETETILAASEVEFIRALRAKYGPLAKQNGNIKISYYRVGDGSNWSESESTVLREDGANVKGLLASDNFTESNTDQNSGDFGGSKLFLIHGGDMLPAWIEITRTGSWSQWQGSSNYWTCDGSFANDREFGDETGSRGVRRLTDEQVAKEYDVKDIAKQLAETLADLAKKLPERLTRKRALAESLQAVTTQLVK